MSRVLTETMCTYCTREATHLVVAGKIPVCRLHADRARRGKNPTPGLPPVHDPDYTAHANMQYKYKRTLADYFRVLAEQGGGCACCGLTPEQLMRRGGKARRLSWDHDHACCPKERCCGTCIRGLLCVRCNLIVGHLEADTTAQLAYIEKWAAEQIAQRALADLSGVSPA